MVDVEAVISAIAEDLRRRAVMVEQDDVRMVSCRASVTSHGRIDLVITQVETRTEQAGGRRQR